MVRFTHLAKLDEILKRFPTAIALGRSSVLSILLAKYLGQVCPWQ